MHVTLRFHRKSSRLLLGIKRHSFHMRSKMATVLTFQETESAMSFLQKIYLISVFSMCRCSKQRKATGYDYANLINEARRQQSNRLEKTENDATVLRNCVVHHQVPHFKSAHEHASCIIQTVSKRSLQIYYGKETQLQCTDGLNLIYISYIYLPLVEIWMSTIIIVTSVSC